MKLYTVYIKGDYVGMTTNTGDRKRKHNFDGNVGNMQLIRIFTKFRDARDFEDKLHAQGYRGAFSKSKESLLKGKLTMQKYKYITPAGVFFSRRDAAKPNNVSSPAVAYKCRHTTKWPGWSIELKS